MPNEISALLQGSLCDSEATFRAFEERLKDETTTRDENVLSHFCVFFLPYNPDTKQVFMIHHKKSGFWIAPGGHIDKGETVLQALNREIQEELGVKNAFAEEQSPFLFTTCPIENNVQPCKMHYDIWYLFKTDGSNFQVDPAEFLDYRWMTIEDARKIVTVDENLKALGCVEKLG